MIIYNVTVSVDADTHEEWLDWMRKTHILDVMTTGMFLSYRLTKMLYVEDEGTVTYAIQYLCKDVPHLMQYQKEFAPALQADHNKHFGGKYAVFRSVLEIIDHNERI